jgi:hypothetical protein
MDGLPEREAELDALRTAVRGARELGAARGSAGSRQEVAGVLSWP